MKYYKNLEDGQVYAYDIADQGDLIEEAVTKGWKDITGSWPPSSVEPEPPKELSPAEKLANAGLTVDELRSLLGL